MGTVDITLVPLQMSSLIPAYDGDEALLQFYIQKCDYVVSRFGDGGAAQQEYLYHVTSSRLAGRAAALAAAAPAATWPALRALLLDYFEDPRSEQFLYSELANAKMKTFEESNLEFYRRVVRMKDTLMAKISGLDDATRQSKAAMYDSAALNTFLCSLTQGMARAVRPRLPPAPTLRDALVAVLDEEAFERQYRAHNAQGTIYPKNNFFGNAQPCTFGTAQPSSFGSAKPAGFGTAQTGTFGSAQAGTFGVQSGTFGAAQGQLYGGQVNSTTAGFGQPKNLPSNASAAAPNVGLFGAVQPQSVAKPAAPAPAQPGDAAP